MAQAFYNKEAGVTKLATETGAGQWGSALAFAGALFGNKNHPGSLGLAISEAVEVAAQHGDTKYALGSVLNHVLLHQTVVGLEAMALAGLPSVKAA